MDNARVDPLEALMASGRVGAQPHSPTNYTSDAIVLNIDFALLTHKIQSILQDAYLNHQPLRDCYSSGAGAPLNPNTITTRLSNDLISLSWFAVSAFYNRLRTIAQVYCPSAVASRMNAFLPLSRGIKFPIFLSNLLSSIGAIRISTCLCAPRYLFIIYAPHLSEQFNLLNHINQRSPEIDPRRYNRLIAYLGACGIGLCPLDYNSLEGALWTTCHLTEGSSESRMINVYGTVPPIRYLNEDIVRSLALMDPEPSLNPFEGIIGLTIRFTDNGAVVADDSLPTTNASSSQLTYDVNAFRFEPANPRGVNTIGRRAGNNSVYTCILARRITHDEVSAVLRYRFLAHAP